MTLVARRVLVPQAVQARPPAWGDRVHEFEGLTMGTNWSVRLSAAPDLDREGVARGIQARLDEVEVQMSTWLPESDLCRYKRSPAGHRQILPAAFADVMAEALRVAEASDGAFDPTVGPAVDAWGFGPPGDRPLPSAESLLALRQAGGWRRIDFDAASRTLVQAGGVALDFSAIAKGYGVDRVAEWLDGRGFHGHLVEVGGELKGSGVKPDGGPWWVALEHPSLEPGHELIAALHGLGIATSGDYRRSFEREGRRYSHTLDPRLGEPIDNGLASVTVLHTSCMSADAWSTALTVMGEAAGLACAKRLGLAARFVSREGAGWRERLSPAFAACLD